jgi:CRP/FNR family transcriptional regulator, anaerobic regulatory protein
MDQLLQFLDSLYPLSQELQDKLVQILKSRVFPKKAFLLKAGHISSNIYFIEKGLVRCFYMVGDKSISAWFMKEGDVVVSVNSFFGQVKSSESIQALEETIVLYISYNELEGLYNRFLCFNVHGRKVLTHYYRLSEQRAISMRSLKAKERYSYLLSQSPELLQRVPRKYLASYIGVTEATFSNINNKPSPNKKPSL